MKQMKKPEYKLAKNVDLEIRLLDDEEAPMSPGLLRLTFLLNLSILGKRPINFQYFKYYV